MIRIGESPLENRQSFDEHQYLESREQLLDRYSVIYHGTQSPMAWTAFNRYNDKWVLCSKARVLGGAEIDVEPVLLIDAAHVDELTRGLRRLLTEELPDVQPPDLNDPIYVLGLRAKAVGAKTWRKFNNAARTFVVREEPDFLMVEEWPKDSSLPVWKKTFPVGMLDEAVRHVVRLTASNNRQSTKKAGQ